MPVWLKAFLAQGSALLVAVLLSQGAVQLGGRVPTFWQFLAVQAVLAGLFSTLYGLPRWWLPIQVLFLPAAFWLLETKVPSVVYLLSFVVLWLVFRSNFRERVPLYLSNRPTWRALAELASERRSLRILDLGAGLGGVVAHLARHLPDGRICGVESAPLPFALAWLRLCLSPNGTVHWGNLWEQNLADYDIVYAFLSPAPMPKLWRKAKAEMRSGSLLISNSFEIPGVPPDRVVEVGDGRRTRLLLWEL